MQFFHELFLVFWYLAYIAFLGIGLILYVASKFSKFLPTLGVYKFPAEIAGVVLMVLGAWLGGGLANEKEWEEKLSRANDRAARAEKGGVKIVKEIQIEYKDRVKKVVEVKEVIKTEIKTVKEYIDRECTITPDAVRIHNQAATGKIIEKTK